MKAFNLSTGEELHFGAEVSPKWAVAYGYCREHNRMSELFHALHDSTFDVFFEKHSPTYGKHSVCVGDWAALKDERKQP